MLIRVSALSGTSCAPIAFYRSAIGIKKRAVMCIMGFVWPSVLIAQGTIRVGESDQLLLLGDLQVNRLHLVLFPSPFCLTHIRWLHIKFCIVLDLLENQQNGSYTDWSYFLHEIILGLPLGRTHTQQVCCKVRVFQRLYHLGHLICICAEIQARKIMKVVVQLLDSH